MDEDYAIKMDAPHIREGWLRSRRGGLLSTIIHYSLLIDTGGVIMKKNKTKSILACAVHVWCERCCDNG